MDDILTQKMVSQIANTPRNSRGYRIYAMSLRTQVAQAVIQLKHNGCDLAIISDRIGISPALLERWIRNHEKKKSTTLVPVRLHIEKSTTLTLHGPCGTRVEDLKVEDLARIFRSIAC
jgi:transposase-like protein